jgi:hypothetical protein
MRDADTQATEIVVRGKRCTVVAQKAKGSWKASGTFDGKLVAIHRASTAIQAFEWWKNKAEMQQPER